MSYELITTRDTDHASAVHPAFRRPFPDLPTAHDAAIRSMATGAIRAEVRDHDHQPLAWFTIVGQALMTHYANEPTYRRRLTREIGGLTS